MHNTNWDDIRYVLAVADTGSVSAAAKVLGVNHATVIRHVTAFEESSGGPVFERSAQGYRLRPDRATVIEAARDAALAVGAVARLMRGGDPGPGALLRVTSVDSLCLTVLGDGFARIAAHVAPHRLALVAANGHLDLTRLQADLTVRPTDTLPDQMAGTIAGELGFAVYRTQDAADAWLGFCGPTTRSKPAAWLDRHVPSDRIAGRADSFVVLRRLAEKGLGLAILPCVLGDASAVLHRVAGHAAAGFPPMRVPLWVAHHRDLEGQARLVRLSEAVIDVLREGADALRG